jgi:hypothetical protein
MEEQKQSSGISPLTGDQIERTEDPPESKSLLETRMEEQKTNPKQIIPLLERRTGEQKIIPRKPPP